MSPPQQTIALYRIIAKLGEGEIREVWRATDTNLNCEVDHGRIAIDLQK